MESPSPSREWRPVSPPAHTDDLIAAGYSRRLAALLATRGVSDGPGAHDFLHPHRRQLNDPFLLSGMEEAVKRLSRAQRDGERVAVVGDYDVDGVTGTALLMAVLKHCGIDCVAILPHRLKDGYGFRPSQVERAGELECRLIITVDCGSTSSEAVEHAAAAQIDVIITDHHIPRGHEAPRALQINPNRPDCGYPFPHLSGVGLALKLAMALAQHMGQPVELEPLLRVACLGTIADVVPLVGENRVIAALGLEALSRTRSHGLRALFREARLKPPLTADDVGYRVGPRLNAVGRLDSPDAALELLLSREPARAADLAAELEEWNHRRKGEEQQVLEEARQQFESAALPGILVAWSAAWHRGVVGIAAGRLSRRFHRPVILLSVGDGSATGSGRSIPGVDLHEFLLPWQQDMERFGGHQQAVGMTVSVQRLETLRQAWEEAADFPPSLLVPHLDYELDLEPAEVSAELVGELSQLEPHGAGNRRPLARVGPLTLEAPPRLFGTAHLEARVRSPDGHRLRLVGWSWQDRREELEGRFEALGLVEWDRYHQAPVLRLVDARPG